MREFPAFVPFRSEHLATVFTVPDESPRGLVLLLTGAGAARSHRFQMWTRTARELARQGLASARLDYEGMGDSTGNVTDWNWSIAPELQHQAIALAEAGKRMLGVDRIGVAGNCLGSLVSLYLAAAMPECVGSVGILTPLFEVNALTGVRRRVRRWKIAPKLKSTRLGHKLLVRPVRRLEGKFNRGVSDRFGRALDHGPMLFVYGDRDDSWSKRVQARLDEMLERVPKDHRDRFELVVLPNVELSGFESIGLQQFTIDTVVSFMARCFANAPASAEAIPSRLDA